MSVPMGDSVVLIASNGHNCMMRSFDTPYASVAVNTTPPLTLSLGLGIGPPMTISNPYLTRPFSSAN